MTAMRVVEFDSSGTTCRGELYLPDGSGRHPGIVLGHGLNLTVADGLRGYAERFAEAGIAALAFDYRGFGRSDGRPRQLLTVRRQHDDFRAAIAALRRREEVDGARVALWGTSFAGGHALALSASEPGLRAVVAQVPFTDGALMALTMPPKITARMMSAGVRDLVAGVLGRTPRHVPVAAAPGDYAVMTTPGALEGYRRIVGDLDAWPNHITARETLRLGTYRPAAKLRHARCPVLVCVADDDTETPALPAILAAQRSPRAKLRRYPVRHFDLYDSEGFERAVSDQVAFLRPLLGVTSSSVETAVG